MSDWVSIDREFVTKEEFRRLEGKVDQILSCIRPPQSSAQSSRFDALSQADNDSTHDYVYPHEVGLERMLLQPHQLPAAAGYTGQVRQETPLQGDCPTSGSVHLQIMEEKLNNVSDKVDRLENRICYRLTPKLSEIQDCLKQSAENTQISRQLDKKLNRLNQKMETLDTNLCDHLTEQMAEFRKEVHGAMDTLKTSVQRIPENVETAAGENLNILQDLAEIKRSNNNIDQGIKKATETLKQEIQSSNFRVEQAVNKRTDNNMATEKVKHDTDQSIKEAISNMMKTLLIARHDILAVTEKECQLVRDRIEGPLPYHKTYTLDFYVKDFKDRIKSDTFSYSLPWHINQFTSSLQGEVRFLPNGKLDVAIVYGRHPREVGLQPRPFGDIKVHATVTDTTGELPEVPVGSGTWNVASEEDINTNTMWGVNIGQIDCQTIVNAGYADIPEYDQKAVLVRYVVDIL